MLDINSLINFVIQEIKNIKNFNGDSSLFIYKDLDLEYIDILSIILAIENNFCVHIKDNIDIAMNIDMSIKDLCFKILNNQ